MAIEVVAALLVLLVVFQILRRFAARSPAAPPVPPIGAAATAPRVVSSTTPEAALGLLASCARSAAAGGLKAVVQARISDHDTADWFFDLSSDGCRLVHGAATSPSLTIAANSDTWRDLASKQLSFASAAMSGRIQYTGDTETLMRLDDAFAGTPDASRLPSQPTAAIADSIGSAKVVVDGSTPADSLEGQRQELIQTLKAISVDSTISPDKRREAIGDALRKNVGATGDVRVSFGQVTGTGSSHLTGDVRVAVRKALQDLPPNATREQRIEAIRGALADVPGAQPFLAMFDAHGAKTATEGRHGLAARIAEAMLESALEGLLDNS
jgi:hypothetical protein